jgi:acyl-CoA thioesterase-1
VLVYGDSLSAAYGIAQKEGWVSLLAERLNAERLKPGGRDYSVANASISGETTSGGVTRIAATLSQHKPAIVVLELGANDGLRGLPVEQMKQNLGRIIEASRKAGAKVLLLGMKMPPNYGPAYTRAFEAAYRDLAQRYRVALLPFFLQSVAARPELFQPDQLHPTAPAQPLILEDVWKALQPLL